MKKIFVLFPALLLSISIISLRTAKNNNTNSIEDQLLGFPLKWIEADVTDEEIIVHEYCEIPSQELWIEQNKDGNWEITVIYGHDAESFSLESVNLEEKEVELYNVLIGSFTVVSQLTGEVENKEVMWNKDSQFCRFDDFFEDAFFADKSKLNEYTHIVEDCD